MSLPPGDKPPPASEPAPQITLDEPPKMTLEEATRIAAHRTLGDLYETRAKSNEGTWGDVREAIDNLLLAGEFARAWPLVESYVAALSTKGLADESLSLLVRCEERGIQGDLLARCLLLRHDLRSSRGDSVDDLAEDVGRALAAAESEGTRGLAIHRLGRLSTEQGNLDAAAGLLAQAEVHAVSAFGEGHIEHAAVLQDLGAVLASAGRSEEAMAVLKRAVGYGETLAKEGHLPNATFGAWLGNCAAVMATRGVLVEAEAMLRRALSLVEQEASRGVAYGALLKDLSDVVSTRGADEEAEVLAGRAVSAFEAALGPSHPMLATSLVTHAERLRALGQSLLAEGQLRKALSVFSEANGADHPQSVEILAKLAEIELMVGNPSALETAEAALEKMDRVLGSEHVFVKVMGPRIRSLVTLVVPGDSEMGGDQTSLFGFYEAEIRRAMDALAVQDGASAQTILLPIAEQTHDAGIYAVEGACAGLLAQAFALTGAKGAAISCAQRAVDLSAHLHQEGAEKRFRALLEALLYEVAEEGEAAAAAAEKFS